MLPFLVSRGGWLEACVLIGRGGSGVDRSRRSRAVSERAVADREGVRGVQWTHCWVHVAGIARNLRRGSASWLCPRTRRKRMRDDRPGCGWSCVSCWGCSEPHDGGACLSIGSVGAGLRGPFGCWRIVGRGVADRGGVACGGQASRCCTARAVGVLPG